MIGLVGLGQMGGAMLRRLRAEGQMRKDVRLALGLAEEVGAGLAVCRAAPRAWEESAVADGDEFTRVPAGIFGT